MSRWFTFFVLPAAETWPFLISLLMQCVSLEISLSKRRLPKLQFAKTLRIAVQRAHDSKFSGICWKVLLSYLFLSSEPYKTRCLSCPFLYLLLWDFLFFFVFLFFQETFSVWLIPGRWSLECLICEWKKIEPSKEVDRFSSGNVTSLLTIAGKMAPLLSVVKLLFNHLWDVLSNVPSFQSEYESILRHLLAIKDYRFHMRKRIYSCKIFAYLDSKHISFKL